MIQKMFSHVEMFKVSPYSFSEILNALYFYPTMIINFKIKILVLC